MKKIKFIDLFAGIGGFRFILEKYNNKCIGFSEINKDAISVYKSNYNTDEIEFGDITKLDTSTIPDFDLLVGGFPCQAWSIAGLKQGFDDEKGRGQLIYDVVKILKDKAPKNFLLENVKGLVDPRNAKSFNIIKEELKKHNYYVHAVVIDSNDFGTPQSRQRVYIMGTKDINQYKKWEKVVVSDYHKPKKSINELVYNVFDKTQEEDFYIFSDIRDGKNTIHSWDLLKTTVVEKAVCMALLKNRRKKKYGPKDGNPLSLKHLQELVPNVNQKDINSLLEKRILSVIDGKYDFRNRKQSSGINGVYRIYSKNSKVFSTITSTGTNDFISDSPLTSKDAVIEIFKNKKYHKMTKKEMLVLQGFPSDFKMPDKDHKYQKLIGNSVQLNVIDFVVKTFFIDNV